MNSPQLYHSQPFLPTLTFQINPDQSILFQVSVHVSTLYSHTTHIESIILVNTAFIIIHIQSVHGMTGLR